MTENDILLIKISLVVLAVTTLFVSYKLAVLNAEFKAFKAKVTKAYDALGTPMSDENKQLTTGIKNDV